MMIVAVYDSKKEAEKGVKWFRKVYKGKEKYKFKVKELSENERRKLMREDPLLFIVIGAGGRR